MQLSPLLFINILKSKSEKIVYFTNLISYLTNTQPKLFYFELNIFSNNRLVIKFLF